MWAHNPALLYKKMKIFEAIKNTLPHGFSANQRFFLSGLWSFNLLPNYCNICKLITHEALSYWNAQEFLGVSSVQNYITHFQNINNNIHLPHSLCFQREMHPASQSLTFGECPYTLSTHMRIYLNPQLFLSGLNNFHIHTWFCNLFTHGALRSS